MLSCHDVNLSCTISGWIYVISYTWWNIIFSITKYSYSSTNIILSFMYPTLVGFLFTDKLIVICIYLFFNLPWQCYVPSGTCKCDTLLWSMGNHISFHGLDKHCSFALATCLCSVMSCLLHCSLLYNPYCCLLFSPMCMPHLFICSQYIRHFFIHHCLTAITCVMWMIVMYLIDFFFYCELTFMTTYIKCCLIRLFNNGENESQ